MEKECFVCFKQLKRAYGPKETPCCKGHVALLEEAKQNRNVLVSYDCNYGPSDIITEKNGFLIPLHDQKKFCEKLELLTSNSNLINDLMLSSFEESKAWKKNEILKKIV